MVLTSTCCLARHSQPTASAFLQHIPSLKLCLSPYHELLLSGSYNLRRSSLNIQNLEYDALRWTVWPCRWMQGESVVASKILQVKLFAERRWKYWRTVPPISTKFYAFRPQIWPSCDVAPVGSHFWSWGKSSWISCHVILLSVHALQRIFLWWILCVLDRASSWYLNKGRPTRWHLLYYLLLNMFQTLIRPFTGACDYLLRCVGWLEACWCYVAGLSVGDVVSECSASAYTQITHHQQTIPLHNTSTPQVSLHNATSSRKLLKMDVSTSETCWAIYNKASVIKLVYLY